MAKTPESKAKDELRKAMNCAAVTLGATLRLESHGGELYSTPTLDYTGSLYHPKMGQWGIPIAIEVKRFDKQGHLTVRQEKTIDDMIEAGYMVFVVENPEHIAKVVNWMFTVCQP